MLTQLSPAAALSLADGCDSAVQLPSQLLFADAAAGRSLARGSSQLQLQSSQVAGDAHPNLNPHFHSSQRSLRSALDAASSHLFSCGSQRTATSLPPQSLPFPATPPSHWGAGQTPPVGRRPPHVAVPSALDHQADDAGWTPLAPFIFPLSEAASATLTAAHAAHLSALADLSPNYPLWLQKCESALRLLQRRRVDRFQFTTVSPWFQPAVPLLLSRGIGVIPLIVRARVGPALCGCRTDHRLTDPRQFFFFLHCACSCSAELPALSAGARRDQ